MAIAHPAHHPQTTSIADISMSDASVDSVHSSAASQDRDQINESQEEEEEYQETQPVDVPEQSSQEKREQEEYEATLWGFLHPCSTAVQRIDFLKTRDTYTFGRMVGKHDVVFKDNNHISMYTFLRNGQAR